MKEFMLSTKEKEEIKDRVTKTASTTLMSEYADISGSSILDIVQQVDRLIVKYPHLKYEDITIDTNGGYDGYVTHEFSFYIPRTPENLQELIEQEEKRVLRKKKADYEQYMKLKGFFE